MPCSWLALICIGRNQGRRRQTYKKRKPRLVGADTVLVCQIKHWGCKRAVSLVCLFKSLLWWDRTEKLHTLLYIFWTCWYIRLFTYGKYSLSESVEFHYKFNQWIEISFGACTESHFNDMTYKTKWINRKYFTILWHRRGSI